MERKETIAGRAAGLDSLIYERILGSMRDGVVTIDLTGRIMTFNAAAGRILGLDPVDVIGQSFAEVFLVEEAFEDFSEVVLRAVYDAETTHNRDVQVCVAGDNRDLNVSSSFLLVDGEIEAARHGVIVVFSDTTEHRKRLKIKRLFGEYLDPRVVERILGRGVDEERGRSARMTVSFSDMRDFTGWSERLPPELLVEMLNRFFGAVTDPIGAAGGLTDKFIGDAVMACWGPPYTDPATQAADACTAALGQIACLPALRRDLAAAGVPRSETLSIAIGIATGEVVSGDVGPERNRNFTVIGNAVNVAARLEGASKMFDQAILVSDETRRSAGEGFVFRPIDEVALRGRTQLEPVHALLGRAGAVPDRMQEIAALHGQGLDLLRGRDFAAAAARFESVLALEPGDVPAARLLARARAYVSEPPAEVRDAPGASLLAAGPR